MKQRSLVPIWSAVATLALLPALARADNISVRVDGQPVEFRGMGPQQMNGRVMVPLRGVLEQMGATVHWSEATRTVTATRNGQDIELPIGSRIASVNGRTVNLDVPAMVIGGTTMVSLRFVGEALGADVRWSDADQTVMIDTQRVASNQDYTAPRPYDPAYDRARPPDRIDAPAQPIIPPPAPINPPALRDDRNYAPSRPHIARNYGRMITLPEGTVIPVRLDTSLSSIDSRPGDRFTATVVSGPDNAGMPDGTRVEGVVREAIPSRNNQPGTLDMEFRRIVFPNGDSANLNASLYSLDGKAVQRDSEGRLIATSRKSNDTLKWVGIGAGAGLILSKVAKGNTLLDTLLGAGAGLLYDQLQGKKPSDVRLGQGTQFGVRMDQQLAFRASDVSGGTGYPDNRYYTPNGIR